MATVNLDLYILWQSGRLVTSPTDRTVPSLPPIVAGDTWQINAYFLDEDLTYHRFAGSSVSARIRAANNHAYADAATSGETSVSAPVVTRTQAGTAFVVEVQHIAFPSPPLRGSFKLGFSGAGSGPRGGGISLEGTSRDLDAFFQISENMVSALAQIGGYFQHNDGPYSWYELHSRYGATIRNVLVNGDLATGYDIRFGDAYNNANWWNTGIHLLTVDDSNLQYKRGFAITLPFTASDFSDYLVNVPSFFEVLLGGNVAVAVMVAAPPSPPVFTNAAPPDGFNGTGYDFLYTTAGFPPATFSVTSGALPAGISLTAAGRLSGTFATAGTFSGVVTATNSAGSATQAFSITVHAVLNPFPGVLPPGGSGALASKRNGNFSVLDYSDGPYYESRDDEWPGLFIWHVPYCIDVDFYLASIPPLGGSVPPWGLFWKDTPFKYLADGVVEFERLFHNIPGDAERVISASKNYQFADFTTQGNQVLDQAIIGYSKDIKVICNYHYALDDPGDLPVVPIIQMIPYLRSQSMWDFDTGFPKGTRNGIPGLYTDNKGGSWLPGGSIDHVLGRLVCRKRLFG